MMKKNTLASFLLLAALLLSGCVRETVTHGCRTTFRATVRQGPSAGLVLTGDLSFGTLEGGRVNGTLDLAEGQRLKWSGQATGKALNWIMELGEENYLFGVGAIQEEIYTCRGVGGGPFTGPQAGDSGDWSWQREATTSSQPGAVSSDAIQNLQAVLAIGLLFLLMVLALVLLASRRRDVRQVASPAVTSARRMSPEDWEGEPERPFEQFVSTYLLGDDRYDISFSLEQKGNFLGEWGAAIGGSQAGTKPLQVSALEVWLFDKNDIQTATRFLVSEFGQANLEERQRLASKGAVVSLRLNTTLALETRTLRLKVAVTALELTGGYFQKVTLKVGAWRKVG